MNIRGLKMTTYTLYPDFFQLAFGHGTPKKILDDRIGSWDNPDYD